MQVSGAGRWVSVSACLRALGLLTWFAVSELRASLRHLCLIYASFNTFTYTVRSGPEYLLIYDQFSPFPC